VLVQLGLGWQMDIGGVRLARRPGVDCHPCLTTPGSQGGQGDVAATARPLGDALAEGMPSSKLLIPPLPQGCRYHQYVG